MSQISTQEESKQNSCKVCTFVNSSLLTQCELCGSNLFVEKSFSWNCPRCTFENNGKNTCELCQFVLQAKGKVDTKIQSSSFITTCKEPVTIEAKKLFHEFKAISNHFNNNLNQTAVESKLQYVYDNLLSIVSPAPTSPSFHNACVVCYEEMKTFEMRNCGHDEICRDCLGQCLRTQIRDQDVMPWLKCPSFNCCSPIAPKQLMQLLSLKESTLFYLTFLHKVLIRNPHFVTCVTHLCLQGWWFDELDSKNNIIAPLFHGKFNLETCNQCHVKQRPGGVDPELESQIQQGKMRPCPLCKTYTDKEKGLCNLIQCVSCKIWWNFNTKHFAETYNDLKAKARETNTLWDPSDFSYQKELEKKDPVAFKKLLQRNGIEWNPNYMRGS
jgi:hypothetical protein